MEETAQVQIVGRRIPGRRMEARLGPRRQPDAERIRHGARDLVLNGEEVIELRFEVPGPEVLVGSRIDELGGHPDPVAVRSQTSFQNMIDAQLPGDLPYGQVPPLEVERRRAGRNSNLLDPREGVQDLLRDSVGQILEVAVRAQVQEGEDSHGGERTRSVAACEERALSVRPAASSSVREEQSGYQGAEGQEDPPRQKPARLQQGAPPPAGVRGASSGRAKCFRSGLPRPVTRAVRSSAPLSHPGRKRRAQALHELGHGWVEGDVQLFEEESLVDLCVPEGGGTVARPLQRLHEPEGRAAVQGVRALEAAPPRHLCGQIASRARHHGQRLQRFAMSGGQLVTPPIEPVFELGRPVQIHAVEEGARVKRGGLLCVPPFQREGEELHVRLDPVGVQAELGHAEQEIGFGQLTSETVDGLLQRPPGPLSVALGPEDCHETVPTDLSVHCKDGEQRQTLAVPRKVIERAAIPFDGEPAESKKSEHRRPHYRDLTGA